jgi:hypothetical protein
MQLTSVDPLFRVYVVIPIAHPVRIDLYVRHGNYEARGLCASIENARSIVIRRAICFIKFLKIGMELRGAKRRDCYAEGIELIMRICPAQRAPREFR